jgi:hypothetical protein
MAHDDGDVRVLPLDLLNSARHGNQLSGIVAAPTMMGEGEPAGHEGARQAKSKKRILHDGIPHIARSQTLALRLGRKRFAVKEFEFSRRLESADRDEGS